jgi:hypothetical protein
LGNGAIRSAWWHNIVKKKKKNNVTPITNGVDPSLTDDSSVHVLGPGLIREAQFYSFDSYFIVQYGIAALPAAYQRDLLSLRLAIGNSWELICHVQCGWRDRGGGVPR